MRSMNNGRAPIDRYKILIGIMITVFVAIVIRLVYLQVFNYTEYKERADTRSMRFLSEQAPRGKIYDSNGDVLATNRQTYTLTFTETDESKKNFYTTINQVYAILKSHNQVVIDNFKLKINDQGKLYFDFTSGSRAEELRFKKDRWLGDKIKNELYKNKEGDLTVEEEDRIDNELMKITPNQVFYYLVQQYQLYDILNPTKEQAKEYSNMDPEKLTDILLQKYSLQQLRSYMIIKDAIKMQSFSGYKPVTIAKDIDKNTAFDFYQKLNDLPGIDVSIEPMRYYPYGELGSSVLGYISSINGDQKSKYEARGYDASTDLIGKAGIESAFENELKGVKGGTTVKVNSSGRKTEELYDLESYPGNNVKLTIDKDIQYSAETMLKHVLTKLSSNGITDGVKTRNATRGAAVAIEVDTGRVLALVSEPGFNPNEFAKGELDPKVSKEYFQPDYEAFAKQVIAQNHLNKTVDDLFPKDEKTGLREDIYDLYPKRFFNYATLGLIPPGSTFKPVTATAAMGDGVMNPNTTIYVSDNRFGRDYQEIFGTNRANWPKDDNGATGVVGLDKALARSSNSFFYTAGAKLYYGNGGDAVGNGKYDKSSIEALDSIAKYSWQYGLGVKPGSNEKASTGIEISENFGQVYNFESYKNQTIALMRFTLVSSLEKGTYVNAPSAEFPKVNIGINERDSKELASAKEAIKKNIEDSLDEIGNGSPVDGKKLSENLKKSFRDLYNVDPAYQESIKNFNGIKAKDEEEKVTKAINLTVEKTVIWVKGDIAYQIVAPRNLTDSAIGQGMSNFTPVQIASYIATLANGGTRYKVHLVDEITDPEGKTVEKFEPEVLGKVDISQKNVDAIKHGMWEVNNYSGSYRGTAYSIMGGFPIPTGGKTGTATFRNDQSDYGRTDYGVYISFAPVDNPKIAVATVIYDGGHGYFGAEVAKAIYETYFRDELKSMGYKPHYYQGSSYDFTLNPPLETIKDGDVANKLEADGKENAESLEDNQSTKIKDDSKKTDVEKSKENVSGNNEKKNTTNESKKTDTNKQEDTKVTD